MLNLITFVTIYVADSGKFWNFIFMEPKFFLKNIVLYNICKRYADTCRSRLSHHYSVSIFDYIMAINIDYAGKKKFVNTIFIQILLSFYNKKIK